MRLSLRLLLLFGIGVQAAEPDLPLELPPALVSLSYWRAVKLADLKRPGIERKKFPLICVDHAMGFGWACFELGVLTGRGLVARLVLSEVDLQFPGTYVQPVRGSVDDGGSYEGIRGGLLSLAAWKLFHFWLTKKVSDIADSSG